MAETNHHVRSLAKGLAILELLAAEGGGMRLAELARRLGFNRTTTHHLLATLRDSGFVDQEPHTKLYSLGYRLVGLVNEFVSDAAVGSLGRGPVQALRDATGDTAYLTVLQGWELFTVFEAPGSQPIHPRRPKRRGQTFLHATASGKTLLAYLPAIELEEVVATVELPRFTPNTIDSSSELRQELASIRQHGYALDREEFLTGVASIAAPVFDLDEACVATVSVVYPAIQSARQDDLVPLVMSTASRISTSLGHVPGRTGSTRKNDISPSRVSA
ncbi:MAG: IclR family transcriptional regulator [Thermomicrobiales bacterium]|nr:IclR family transcriptional regulator [Thermomicrobiales bacterium]